jgi:hypothetical protein
MIVEFFSTDISVRVCKYLNWECSVFMDNYYPVADSEVRIVIVFPSLLVDYSDVPPYPDISVTPVF